jgi:hypothetical protein
MLIPEVADALTAAIEARRVERRAWRPFRPRRRLLAVGLVLLAASSALAAGGLLGRVDRGTAGGTTYTLSAASRDGQLCLRIEWSGARAAIRCDPPPSAARPLGPILRTVAPDGRGQLLAGLVRADVRQVRVLGHGALVKTQIHRGVPGRVFVLKGRFPRVRIDALAADGTLLARLGTEPATSKPASRAQAKAQGDPAAFAPAAQPPPFTFHGRPISDRETTRRHLACSSDTGVCVTKAEFLRQLRHPSRTRNR